MGFLMKGILGNFSDPLELFHSRKPAAPQAPPPVPTMQGNQGAMDAAERANAAAAARRTSTMLAPTGTGSEDSKKTSKVLLGQ